MNKKKTCIIGIVCIVLFGLFFGVFFAIPKIKSYNEEKKIVQEFKDRDEDRTFIDYIKGPSKSVIDYAILFNDLEKGGGVEIKTETGIGTLFLGTDMPEQKRIKEDEKMELNKEKDGVCFTMWEASLDELIDYEILVTDIEGDVNFKVKGKVRE